MPDRDLRELRAERRSDSATRNHRPRAWSLVEKHDLYGGSAIAEFGGLLFVAGLAWAAMCLFDGRPGSAALLVLASGAVGFVAYLLSGGASNPALYEETPNSTFARGGRAPPVPPISATDAVVDWFLAYDEKIGDLRLLASTLGLQKAREEILNDLSAHREAASLKAHLDKVSAFWSEMALPAAATRFQDGPIAGESEADARMVMLLEAVLAAKVRVLGYFLLKRHGIQPE